MVSMNKVERMGEGCQDDWMIKVWRIIARFLMPGKYLLGTAAGLFLQNKHLTFTVYETIGAKEQQATTNQELRTVRGHLQSLGPEEGATPRSGGSSAHSPAREEKEPQEALHVPHIQERGARRPSGAGAPGGDPRPAPPRGRSK